MKIKKNDKLILVDVDAILLNWVDGFTNWGVDQGLTLKPDYKRYYKVEDKFEDIGDRGFELLQGFNRSDYICDLEPIPEAQKYIKRLASHRYKFHAITSIEPTPEIVTRRKNNLMDTFGDVFSVITCLDYGVSKKETLKQYINTQQWWIEDNARNALTGYDLGLRTVLMNYEYNQDFEHPGIYRVNDWEELYNLIREY